MSHRLPLSVLAVALVAALPAAMPPDARAQTARSLQDTTARHIVVDGFTSDWTGCERVFCTTRFDCGACDGITARQESEADSKWGVDNDLNQIRVTWDAHNLYFAGEGVIYGNNMILWLDLLPDRGLERMTDLNSWRRNFTFGADFRPDAFGATWDGNASPRLLLYAGGNQVTDTPAGALFRGSATFAQSQRGRAMEFVVPWSTLVPTGSLPGARDTVLTVGGVTDTFHLLPPGTRLKIAGALTAGWDGSGGPDTAPDVTRCLADDAGRNVVVDNYAIVDLDRRNDLGLAGVPADQPDGMPDWGVDPRARVSFLIAPPIQCLRIELADLALLRPAFAPTLGQTAPFTFTLDPKLDPADPVQRAQSIAVTANVYDMRGRFVRNLYVNQTRPAVAANPGETWPADPAWDTWDGRDANGAVVPPGVYVLRVVMEPSISRVTRALVVVR